MQESKYFYNGIPLSKYCKENDINISTIYARIWKKKQNKKYDKYTEQEIVNMVIEAYGSAVKYVYKGMSLRQYCLENNINFETINSRIINLRKKYQNLSNDELVILAMEEFDNKNFRFFYDGMPLKQYCEIHPEINYNTIRTYINREKKRNPELSDTELIEQYLNKEHKGIYRYYYLGIPLKQYCDENNMNYKNIIVYISRYRNAPEYEDLNDDEFVEAIIEKHQQPKPKYQYNKSKYLYKGFTLREYCHKNNLSYNSVVSFVKRKIINGSTKSIDELIDEGIKTINRYGIIYYYKGIPLVEYARANDMNPVSIRQAILRKQLKSNKPLQEIIDECVESYQKFSIKYYYKGIPLLQFCNNIGLSYNTIVQKYLCEYSDKTDISVDEAINQIVDYYINNPPVRTKYFFNNQSLAKFCDINGYSYFAIWYRIKKLEFKSPSLSNEQIIESAIKKYEDKLELNKLNELFNELKINKIQDRNTISSICEFLKIDFENVEDLINMDFSYNQAINMIWYFSDKTTDDGYKIITDKKIKDIFCLIDNLENGNEKIENFELYDLIGIYKSELYDSRNEILLREKKYINKILYTLCSEYSIKVNKNNYEDFESEIKYALLKLIDRTNMNIYGQIIKYMDLTVKGCFRTFLKKYVNQKNNLSLDTAMYLKDKGTGKEKSRIDYIPDYDNPYEESEKLLFSSEMMEILSSLPKSDLTFIMLKYQENYSDEELADYFNLTIDEVNEKENKILSLLKNNGNIKSLRKIKH